MTTLPAPQPEATVPILSEQIDQVVGAVIKVMKRIKEVPKRGKHKTEGYFFVQWIDVMATVQTALAEEGLIISQRETKRAIAGYILFATFEFDIYHVSGQYILRHTAITGAARHQYKNDSYNDKAMNICCVTAHKYATMSIFKIPPEDAVVIRDFPDSEEDDDRGGAGSTRVRRDRDAGDDNLRRDTGDDAGRRHDDRPNDDRLSREDRELRDKVHRLREELNDAPTITRAEEVWRDYRNVLEVVSNATYNDLKDEYRGRWREDPPVIPAAPPLNRSREETS